MEIHIELIEQDLWYKVLASKLTNEEIDKIKKDDPDFVPETEEEFEERLKDAEGKFSIFGMARLDDQIIKLVGASYLPEERSESHLRMAKKLMYLVANKMEKQNETLQIQSK